MAGHRIREGLSSSLGMYPPSKFAVTGLTQMLRQELRMMGSNVKVTVRSCFFPLRIFFYETLKRHNKHILNVFFSTYVRFFLFILNIVD